LIVRLNWKTRRLAHNPATAVPIVFAVLEEYHFFRSNTASDENAEGDGRTAERIGAVKCKQNVDPVAGIPAAKASY
jgi:hypothetical protein